MKNYEGSKHTHRFQDTMDENERDFDFWMYLLEKHQQYNDLQVIVSLYAGKKLFRVCCTYRRRIACIVQTESQMMTMLNSHKSFQLPAFNVIEYPGTTLPLLFML